MYTPDKDEPTRWEVPYGDNIAVVTREPTWGMFLVHMARGETPPELDGKWTVLDRCIHDINMTAQRRGKFKKEIAA